MHLDSDMVMFFEWMHVPQNFGKLITLRSKSEVPSEDNLRGYQVFERVEEHMRRLHWLLILMAARSMVQWLLLLVSWENSKVDV